MIELRSLGKTYIEIASTLSCSEWTVKHQLIPNRKKNQQRYFRKKGTDDPLFLKRKRFLIKGTVIPFSLGELKSKIGKEPRCYLTGEPIDLMKPETYSLDHIIPISRGGKSSLDNIGLCKSDVNQAKYDMTPTEFISLCKRVIGAT